MIDEEDYHQCHFCGEYVKDGYESNGRRHFLSDCRPDLVEHEIGELCTWAFRRLSEFNQHETGHPYRENETCYAYRNTDLKWTNEHIHFYPDGPM
ncbi:MAG: hypothetical protein HMLIMOIP_002670 [Candidatus Nitrosomirales archaeon]|jgi:hypothetical protein